MSSETISSRRPRRHLWLALCFLLAGLAGTGAIWRFVSSNEAGHVRRMTKLVGAAVRADASADADSWTLGLVRLSKWWELEQTPREPWVSSAELYIQHHPGCRAIEFVDVLRKEQIGTIAPGTVSEHLSLPSGARQRFLAKVSEQGKPTSIPFETETGQNEWITALPIYRKDQLRGFVLAEFDLTESVDTMADDVKGLGFSIAIGQPGKKSELLPGSTPQNQAELGETLDVDVVGVPWQVTVWPKPTALQEMRSSMPETTLLAGILLSLLLALTVFFAQSTFAKTKYLEEANQQLTTENAERRRVEEALRASQKRFAGILEISADAIISVDEHQRIKLYNQGAEKMFGYPAQEVLGQSLGILLPARMRAAHAQHVSQFGRSSEQTLVMSEQLQLYGLRKDGREFRMVGSVAKLEINGEKIFTSMLRDVTDSVRAAEELRRAHDELELRVRERTADLETTNTALQAEIAERQRAEDSLRELSERLMRLQDEERRRIARELHDGTIQDIAALALNLNLLKSELKPSSEVDLVLSDCLRLVNQTTGDLRTISYLLHPPVLEELGLTRTLQNYVDGFSRRSGIAVELEMTPQIGHLPAAVELTLFRIVQEALCNIHRHSDSSTAQISLLRTNSEIVLEIADQGRGISPQTEGAGVGISGMRERVRLLGGDLKIHSSHSGTAIRAILQVQPQTRASLVDSTTQLTQSANSPSAA